MSSASYPGSFVPKQTDIKQLIRRYTARLVPKDDPGIFNQALMELGALVCAPQQPECEKCCWASDCRAYQELEDPSELPTRTAKPEVPHYDLACSIIWKRDEVLIVRRPPEGLLANLWEFPTASGAMDEDLGACCRRQALEELGLEVEVIAPFLSFEHAYSHLSTTVHAFYCSYREGVPTPKKYAAFRWVKLQDLAEYAFPKASKLLLDYLLNQSRSGGQMDLFNPQWGQHR